MKQTRQDYEKAAERGPTAIAVKVILAVFALGILTVGSMAWAAEVPTFVTERSRHWLLGFAEHPSALERAYFIKVDGMPERLNQKKPWLSTPRIIEIRGYIPGAMPNELPVLRVLWDSDGDGISDYGAEVLDYDGSGKPQFGRPKALRLPMDSTAFFELPKEERL